MTVGRVLIVDDEPDICELVAEVAEMAGFTARMLTGSKGFRGALAEFNPQAIVLDLLMPGMDGVELMRMLAESASRARLVLISGQDQRVLHTARELGAAHGLSVEATLAKPLNIKALRAALDGIARASLGSEPAELASALAAGQFTLHYQPKIDLRTGDVAGMEALCRWVHPTRGLLQPEEFLPACEDADLMDRLAHHVLGSAIRQAAEWRQAGMTFPVSVNVTARLLVDLAFPDTLAGLLSAASLPPSSLILEITEPEAMRETRRIMDVLLRLRLKGVGLTIDDFGTGYTSLPELRRMPFTEMKIDHSFINEMEHSADAATIVHSVISLGHSLGLQIAAEGVGDDDTWQMLLNRGCDMAQGFHFAPPMPAQLVPGWLDRWKTRPNTQRPNTR